MIKYIKQLIKDLLNDPAMPKQPTRAEIAERMFQ